MLLPQHRHEAGRQQQTSHQELPQGRKILLSHPSYRISTTERKYIIGINTEIFARFIKVGGGEMLFRVINYCRMKEVFSNGGQPFSFSFKEPLIVLNNFAENNQVRQIGRSIQELFPNINLEKIKINNVKRVMSFTYQPNRKCIYFRHYKIMIK